MPDDNVAAPAALMFLNLATAAEPGDHFDQMKVVQAHSAEETADP